MELQEKILSFIDHSQSSDDHGLSSLFISEQLKEDHQKIIGALKSIHTLGDIIATEPLSHKTWELTDEGRQIAENGSYEALVFNFIPDLGGVEQSKILTSVTNGKIGVSKALKNGWIKLVKTENGPKLEKNVEKIHDSTRGTLNAILKGESDRISNEEKQDLKKRKLLTEVTTKSLKVTKGPEFTTKLQKLETDLSVEALINNSWKTKKYKDYNFNALGVRQRGGCLHPLLKVRTEYRQIFLEMGFSEMSTDQWVESSFWNFDALFVPQQHPARDAQDTFFVSGSEKDFILTSIEYHEIV
uniref:Phenylalanine--tRNA ligase n=1 Tax=Romanomermis culicivorax TaxID=13658 RepID=A0A915JRI6_ROMCU